MIVRIIQEEIKNSFDPLKLDQEFALRGRSPDWLEFMLRKASWRMLLYQLCDSYPDCLILSYSIRRCCEAGHLDEISAFFVNASTSFKVFHTLLLYFIQQLATIDLSSVSTIGTPTEMAKQLHYQNPLFQNFLVFFLSFTEFS